MAIFCIGLQRCDTAKYYAHKRIKHSYAETQVHHDTVYSKQKVTDADHLKTVTTTHATPFTCDSIFIAEENVIAPLIQRSTLTQEQRKPIVSKNSAPPSAKKKNQRQKPSSVGAALLGFLLALTIIAIVVFMVFCIYWAGVWAFALILAVIVQVLVFILLALLIIALACALLFVIFMILYSLGHSYRTPAYE